jgi:hypothetical protein
MTAEPSRRVERLLRMNFQWQYSRNSTFLVVLEGGPPTPQDVERLSQFLDLVKSQLAVTASEAVPHDHP